NNMVRLGLDGTGSIYVLQVNYAAYPAIGSLTVFAADAQDDAPPIRTLILPGDGLSAASAFALDQQGRVFVGYTYGGLVRVFTANVDGTPPAIRIFGTKGDDGSAGIVDLAVDDNGLAYVLTSLQLRVYGPDAANDDPPLRVVTLDTGAQNAGLDVAIDGRVFLANDQGIAVLAANASGAATPLFTFGTAAKNAVAIAP
ncbi:MAG: hypothetical protein ABI627_15480, partial [Polyangiaceae bacterium]